MNIFCIVGLDNMMTNTSMSIYNKTTNSTTKKVSYKKHLIEKVFWDDVVGVKLNTGFENADKVNVYIPFDKNDLSKYKLPKQYDGSGWTIQNGDFIVKGNINIDNVEKIKDLDAYEVFVVNSVDIKDFGSDNMQHFEIRGI